MQSAVPSAVTDYKVSLRYMTPVPVGSLDLLFCENPIPYEPCVVPQGLDVSSASLTDQTGETGFTILSQSVNHIILTRDPTMISSPDVSSYTFDNITNPNSTAKAFSIRLKSLTSVDGTGDQIDFGSVRGQVTDSIVIEAQVPPMLIFCLAQKVQLGCLNTNGTYFTNMGELSTKDTLTAQSQMAAGTNATAGFVIFAVGDPPTAGTSVIDGLTVPSLSQPGQDQFGINLVENTAPSIGIDPEGTWANAQPEPDYSTPNLYKYVSGDAVAYSTDVSLMKKFTVSYILNSSRNLRPGVYSTTITFIASGRF